MNTINFMDLSGEAVLGRMEGADWNPLRKYNGKARIRRAINPFVHDSVLEVCG
jgi:hypothetical protein